MTVYNNGEYVFPRVGFVYLEVTSDIATTGVWALICHLMIACGYFDFYKKECKDAKAISYFPTNI